jgi:diamine N-acetyltransferase
MVTLRDVTAENWRDCIRLSLHEHQVGYVASNVATIAESKFNPHFHLRAIYTDDSPVGLLAYCHEDDPEDLQLFWIFRLMIDRNHQGNGYGADAMRLAIDEIKKLSATRVKTMHKPENLAAAALYAKLGFCAAGKHDDGDCLLELDLSVAAPNGNK